MPGENSLIDGVLGTINKYHMLDKGDAVVLGLSGGADSCTLLRVLTELRREWGIALYAIHINHNLRGEEAILDQHYCARICEEYGVLFTAYSADVRGEALKGESLEEASRRIRYDLLERARAERGADRVAVAHNKNDAAETVLMRLMRGTGLQGLTGIPPVRGRIIRPLIETGRPEIEAFCRMNRLDYRVDSTNHENTYTRNRVRNLLIPCMEKEFNPNIIDTLCRAAELLAADEAFITSAAEEAFAACGGGDGLDIALLRSHMPAVAGRIIRLALEEYCGTRRDITAAHVGAVLELCDRKSGKRVSLPGGAIARREYGRLVFSRGVGAAVYCYALRDGSPVYIAEAGMWAAISHGSLVKMPNGMKNVYTKAFDYDKIKGECVVRTRLPGDRIYFQSVGTKKLKDYFSDRKTPREQRDSTPLIACGGEIMSIVGFGESDRFRPDSDTANTIYIQLWGEIECGNM